MFKLRVAVIAFCLVSAPAAFAQPADDVLLKNWAAPPFWQPEWPVGIPRTGQSFKAEMAAAVPGEQALALPSRPLPFVAVPGCRVVDTRGNGFTGPYGPPALLAMAERDFTITGQCGIPAGAAAVSFEFTAVNMTSNGNFRAWPQGDPMPTASVLNWSAAAGAIGNGIVVPISSGGGLAVYVNAPASNTVDLVLDVNGYYAPTGIVNTVNLLSGDLTLAEGTNVTIMPTGNTLTFNASAPAEATGPTGPPGRRGRPARPGRPDPPDPAGWSSGTRTAPS